LMGGGIFMVKYKERRVPRLAAALAAIMLLLSITAMPAGADAPFVRDEYGALAEDRRVALEQTAQGLENNYSCDVYFVITGSIGDDDIREHAKGYYTSNALGYGAEHSGILFFVAAESRKYVTVTYGMGIDVSTDYRIAQVENELVPYLSSGDWNEAAARWYALCAETLEYYAQNGEPIRAPEEETSPAAKLAMAAVPAFIASCFVCFLLCHGMKTNIEKTEADEYAGGLELGVCIDKYTHTTEVEEYDPPSDSHDRDDDTSVDSDGFGGSSGGSF